MSHAPNSVIAGSAATRQSRSMLAPPPLSPDPKSLLDRRPQWGSEQWGVVRRPILQLIAAPVLTILALALTVDVPRGPWMLLPLFGPATAIAFLMNRRNGLVLMWPLLLLASILAVWAAIFLTLVAPD